MRVKSLVAAATIAVAAAVMVVPGVSSASRGGRVEPNVQPNAEEPVAEETPAPVVEEAPAAPVVEEVPAAPVEEQTPAAPVTAEPAAKPVVAKPKASVVPAPPAADEPPAPAPVEAVPVVEVPAPLPVAPQAAPAPAADKRQGPKADRGQPDKGRCHMESYEAVEIASLTNADEAARARKVDRNGNGTVCRKDIPGRGKGNTGQNSNIKDDQA